MQNRATAGELAAMTVAECLLITLIERGLLHPGEAESALEDARVVLSSVAEEAEDASVYRAAVGHVATLQATVRVTKPGARRRPRPRQP